MPAWTGRPRWRHCARWRGRSDRTGTRESATGGEALAGQGGERLDAASRRDLSPLEHPELEARAVRPHLGHQPVGDRLHDPVDVRGPPARMRPEAYVHLVWLHQLGDD